MNNQLDDQTLMAYADGELDAVQAARVEQAMKTDAGIAARVAQHRALREKLQCGLNEALSEPVPQHLLDILHAPPTAATNKVVEFAQSKSFKTTQPRIWSSREWLAMAASLIAGVAIGLYALNFTSEQLVTEQGGALVAQGKLDDALTTQLAGTVQNASIKIGISFRNRNGEYCRSFALAETRPLAGLACHEQEQWRVQMLTESTSDTGEFRQAASATPEIILQLIEQQIEGEPLDAEAEAAAQRNEWE